MPWIKLTIDASEVAPANVELVLESLGANAITLEDAGDDPQLEPGVGETPLWRETRVSGLFPAEQDVTALKQSLAELWPGKTMPRLTVDALEDRDWTLAWADHARVTAYGDRLWACPDAEAHPEVPDDAVRLIIPPGLAFGTGSHPTTAMCLEWLNDQVRPGMTVMDYGCGSGILAVAAARLGADRVIAVDNDPQALTATLDNARANGVEDRLGVHLPDDCPDEKVDLLVANILANPLIELAPVLCRHLKAGAGLALTGILSEQADAVAAAYGDNVTGLQRRQREEWVLLQGQRPPAGD
ncbi:50S ribosomal protein L11 methyltransferase [Natronospira bacteriovora]|uniref:Ribosomal protein L11 methyltransferase n=1 Tax=Natronospira bacteriovora TaxID=3069753 RepID=A0ABU0W852_9GAMM|nr:50S ribosomal protein L11 methyltransferase [Natronospira sp. AB-CW4]MDQ2069640.1 50S ribosomal protein L11 methyltransferase [Natronospira sp. AB-CW4]